VLNNLNRGLGLADGYPFVLSPPVIAKLRFVHDTITETAAGTAAIASAPAATPAPPAPATEPPSPAAAPTPGT